MPEEDGDDVAEWRAELVKRYGSVIGFLDSLARLQFGAVDVRFPVLVGLRRLSKLVGTASTLRRGGRNVGHRLVAAPTGHPLHRMGGPLADGIADPRFAPTRR